MTEQTTHRFCVAPMMDWTDRFDRYFLRLISRHARLYTEMVTTGAVVYGDREHLLRFDPSEHPVALQLGGSDPAALAEAARIGEAFGYDEINLNVGCPSDRVQSGRFGACLMREPDLVAECVAAMRATVTVPVTVKSRIGVDDQDPNVVLPSFVERVAAAGCRIFIVHARKAWLDGLSPKENRTVPPLDYELVYRLKQDRPDLTIVINGGIPDVAAAEEHCCHVDGVMLGRAAYQTPYNLSEVDRRLYGDRAVARTRGEVVRDFLPFIEEELKAGVPLHRMTRHILGLYQGVPGARVWRRCLSEGVSREGAGIGLILEALDRVEGHMARANERSEAVAG